MGERPFKTLKTITEEYMAYVIFRTGTRAEAARILGVHDKTLRDFLKRYGLPTSNRGRPSGAILKGNADLKEKFPVCTEFDFNCTPNLTPEEKDFLLNRDYNHHIPPKISSNKKSKL
jgi:hypothetical protein